MTQTVIMSHVPISTPVSSEPILFPHHFFFVINCVHGMNLFLFPQPDILKFNQWLIPNYLQCIHTHISYNENYQWAKLEAQEAWSNLVQIVRSMQTRIGFKTWCNNCENKTMFWAQSGLYFNLISSFQSRKDYKSVLFSAQSKLKRKGKGPMKQFELT